MLSIGDMSQTAYLEGGKCPLCKAYDSAVGLIKLFIQCTNKPCFIKA
jgi:hypothetical protein